MPISRRTFLAAAAAAVPATALGREAPPADVVIIGGGTGGVAAALAACRAGAKRVIMTEETAWIGGQLTSQLVPPDENEWIESGGAPKSFRDYREAVRNYYKTRPDKPLRPAYRDSATLNPGSGWVSRLCHEPIVGLHVLEGMLLPYVAAGQLLILRNTVPVSADVANDRVTAVGVKNTLTGDLTVLAGKFFLDATEEGDLLPLAKVEFVTGSESAKETTEPNASPITRPGNVQSFTWCFILEHRDGEDHTIPKPAGYDFWAKYPAGEQPLFNWDSPAFSFYPKGDKDPGNPKANFWTYRRVINANAFAPGAYKGDVSVVNWHMNDYTLGGLHCNPPAEAAKHKAKSREMSLALVHWLQTACPRSDGKAGWPGLRLCPEQTGTPDGLALAPYIRESRRIKAAFTILEQHVSRPLREKEFGKDKARAEVFPDTVGIGHYLYMDLHATCEGEKKGGWPVFPFQIPLGALIPVRVKNLFAAAKNLGVTHLTNGCYRLHPVEWNIGEAAGAAAAFCAAGNHDPKQLRDTPKLLADYQRTLTAMGTLLEWPANAVRGGRR